MDVAPSDDMVGTVLEELISNVVARSFRRMRRKVRVAFSCEGCSASAVENYGLCGHPSQTRHMEYGGCLSEEYLNADSGVSSDEE